MLKNQKNLKLMLASFVLMISSLACLQTTAAIAPEPVSAAQNASPTLAVHAAEPTLTKSPTAAADQQICAKVIAIEALNVRAAASDKDIILTWLKNGEVVQVIDQSDGDWWFIMRNGISGYARSSYLQKVECVK